jgi:hypothetical protein
MLAGLFVSLFDFMGGPASTGETVFAFLVLAVASGLVIASAANLAYVSGHKRPFVQASAAIVVFALTMWVSLQILGSIRGELMLATPFIAIGAMLSVLLPGASPPWALLRAISPGLMGILVISAMMFAGDQFDVSYGIWSLALVAGLVLGLAAVVGVEFLRR